MIHGSQGELRPRPINQRNIYGIHLLIFTVCEVAQHMFTALFIRGVIFFEQVWKEKELQNEEHDEEFQQNDNP
jgi:hypothetical protein